MSYPNPNQQGQQGQQNFFNIPMQQQGSSNGVNPGNAGFPGQFSSPQQAFASPQLSRQIPLQQGVMGSTQVPLTDVQRMQQQQAFILAQQQQQQRDQSGAMGLSPNMSNNLPLQGLSPQMQAAMANPQFRQAHMQQFVNNAQNSNNARLNLPPGMILPGGGVNPGISNQATLTMQQIQQLQQAQQNQRIQNQQANAANMGMIPVQHPHPPPRTNQVNPAQTASPFAMSPQLSMRSSPSPSMRPIANLPHVSHSQNPQHLAQQARSMPPQGINPTMALPPQQGRSPHLAAATPQMLNPALMHLPSHSGSPSGPTVPLPGPAQNAGAGVPMVRTGSASSSTKSPAPARQPLPLPPTFGSTASPSARPHPELPPPSNKEAVPKKQATIPPSTAPITTVTPSTPAPPKTAWQGSANAGSTKSSKSNNTKSSASARQTPSVLFSGIQAAKESAPVTAPGDVASKQDKAERAEKAEKAEKRERVEKGEDEVKKTYDGIRGGMRSEIARLMYACGDAQDPDPQAVEYMEDLVVEFIGDLCRPEPPIRANTLAPHQQPQLSADVVRRRLASTPRMRKYLERFDYMTMMSSTIAEARRVDMPTNEDLVRTVGSEFLGLDQDGHSRHHRGAIRRTGAPEDSNRPVKRRGRPPKRRLDNVDGGGDDHEGEENGPSGSPEKRKPGPRRGWKKDPEAIERSRQKREAKRRKPTLASTPSAVKFEV